MFKSKPDKTKMLDQLDVQIEEHRRISRTLEKEYNESRKDIESLTKKGLKRAAKLAYQGFTDVRNQLEAIEINRIQLRRVRTQLLAQPDRLPTKTLEGVDKILKDSQNKAIQAQTSIQHLIDRGGMVVDISLDTPEIDSGDIDEEGFDALLQEMGLGETTPGETQEIEFSLPDIPQDVPSTNVIPDKEEKEKVKEDNL